MQNIIILVLIGLIPVICLGNGWTIIRTTDELRESIRHQLETQTRDMQFHVQQDMALLRQALKEDMRSHIQQEVALLHQALKEDMRSHVQQERALLRQMLREEAGEEEQKSEAGGETVDEGEAVAVLPDGAPQVDRVDNDYRLLSLADLQKIKEPEADFERFRRGVDAMIAYNSRVNLSQRWYINGAAIRKLVGGGQPHLVRAYLDSRRAEIEAHHHKYRLLPDHNQGRGVSIRDCIAIPDPQGACITSTDESDPLSASRSEVSLPLSESANGSTEQ